MAHMNNLECCAVMEMADIYTGPYEMSVKRIHPDWCKFVIFSDTDYTEFRHGKAIAAIIRKNKLGTLISTAPARNPNTGHKVKVWTWTIDRDGLKAYRRRKP